MIKQAVYITKKERVNKITKQIICNDSNYFTCIAFHTNTGNIYTLKLDHWSELKYEKQIKRIELFNNEPKKYDVSLILDFCGNIESFTIILK